MSLYARCLRPALFALPPELAHDLAKASLATEQPWKMLAGRFQVEDPRLEVDVGGLALANPVGLSAGFDKNATALAGLQHLGFGAITVGSILPKVRAGNPKPRLMRYPRERSLANCYGLPSDGLDACVARLRASHGRARRSAVIANIDAPSIDLYVRSFEAVEPLVDAVELGLQCPNNREDRGEFHEPRQFEALIREISKRRKKPLFVKLGLWVSETERQNRLELVDRAARLGVDGVNLPGIFKQPEPQLSLGTATVSGRLAFERTRRNVIELAQVTRGRMAIKANGGVFTGEDVLELLLAGAAAVDLLTAFVYRGWDVAAQINRELLAALERARIPNLRHIRNLAGAA